MRHNCNVFLTASYLSKASNRKGARGEFEIALAVLLIKMRSMAWLVFLLGPYLLENRGMAHGIYLVRQLVRRLISGLKAGFLMYVGLEVKLLV